jgi:hypothetical protein
VHVYCLDEEMEEMPEGDWVWPTCEQVARGKRKRREATSSRYSREAPSEEPSVTVPNLPSEREQESGSGERTGYVLGGPPLCQHAGCMR